MPYKNLEDRRAYIRGYMRTYRAAGFTNRGKLPIIIGKVVNPDVNPSRRAYRPLAVLDGLRLDEMTPEERTRAMRAATIETSILTSKATSIHVRDYLRYLHQRNLELVETARGYEMVDLTTGEGGFTRYGD